jgi:hypothetical protein
MSEDWFNSFERTLAGEATRAEFIASVTEWLKNEDISGGLEGRFEAVSRRVVWVFPKGWAFVVGSGHSPTFYHVDELMDPDSPFLFDDDRSEGWEFRRYANGWELASVGTDWSAGLIAEWVERFSSVLGSPKLSLPWGYAWLDRITEQEEYYYSWEEKNYSDNPELSPYKIMSRVAAAAEDGQLAEVSPWTLEVGEEDDYMSEFSDWARFHRVVAEIEESKLMIVNLDEHCAACNSGVYEWAVKDDPELEGKNIFLTWGQGSEGGWLGNGFIATEVEFESSEDECAVWKLLVQEGLEEPFEGEEECDPVGSWEYESLR